MQPEDTHDPWLHTNCTGDSATILLQVPFVPCHLVYNELFTAHCVGPCATPRGALK